MPMRNVLIVDADESAAFELRDALIGAAQRLTFHHVGNAHDARLFLRQTEPYDDCPRPDLVLLSGNLVGDDALHVLKYIKSSSELCIIPVIVLLPPGDARLAYRAYLHRANCVVPRPNDKDEMEQLIRPLREYWLNTAILPPLEDRINGGPKCPDF